jgi:hypothetical protein
MLALALSLCAACDRSSTGVDDPVDDREAAASLVVAPVHAACGTPVVDGVLSPGEWEGAVSVRFAAFLPELTDGPGAVVPAEIRALSDDANLYVSFRLATDTSRFAQSHVVHVDADASRSISAGDDALVFSWDRFGFEVFADDFYADCVVDDHPALCSYLDTAPPEGTPAGTFDGGAAITFGEEETTVELWHPYTGGDPRDVLRQVGESIGMQFFVRLLTVCDVDVNDWPASARCFGDTYFPPPGSDAYRPFVLGCGGAPPEQEIVEVRIDIKPGDALPTIPLGSGGSTTVAVMGSEALDVGVIDPATVWFAGAPVERTVQGAPRASFEDVDGDGRDDFVAHFSTAALELGPDTREATLAGRTVDGRRFHGTDAVRVIFE